MSNCTQKKKKSHTIEEIRVPGVDGSDVRIPMIWLENHTTQYLVQTDLKSALRVLLLVYCGDMVNNN